MTVMNHIAGNIQVMADEAKRMTRSATDPKWEDYDGASICTMDHQNSQILSVQGEEQVTSKLQVSEITNQTSDLSISGNEVGIEKFTNNLGIGVFPSGLED
jgi:hypothetical protein